jgi:hypothetical protein
MPRGRLTESYVQGAALAWLAGYYAALPDVQAVIHRQEVVVRGGRKQRRGRADGLVIMQRAGHSPYVAALEAKSSKTFSALLAIDPDERYIRPACLAGLAGLLLAGGIGWSIGGWFWQWAFPLLMFLLIGFAYLTITLYSERYKQTDVIAQVRRYPANEQWIALSTDSWNQVNLRSTATLHADCRKQGIGLLRVSAGSRVKPIEYPQANRVPKGTSDFLVCYAREQALRKLLKEAVEAKSRPADPPTLVATPTIGESSEAV